MSLDLQLPEISVLETTSDPGERILIACENARAWLAQLLEEDRVDDLVEAKSQARAIEVYMAKKNFGLEAQLSAAEIVRRAERCIGLAIRKGQKEGRIRKVGDDCRTDLVRRTNYVSKETPAAHFKHGDEQTQTYAMTDGVSDAQFEKAISEAKAERNLSRANVVRRLKGNGKADPWARLAELAADGNTSHQIARKLGFGREAVVRKAKKLGIDIRADRVMGRSRIPKPDKILREFVNTLDSLAPSVDLIEISSLSPEVIAECLPIMEEAMKSLHKLARRLRGVNRG